MQSALKKVFANDKVFAVAAILGCAGKLIYSLLVRVTYSSDFPWTVLTLFSGLCTLPLYFSYRDHSKNVMKAMMGVCLMALLAGAICNLQNFQWKLYFVLALLHGILILLLLVNHLIINSEHRPSPKMVFTNQVLCILVVILNVVWDLSSGLHGIIAFVDIVGHTCVIAAIVCVESLLDAYRLERETK